MDAVATVYPFVFIGAAVLYLVFYVAPLVREGTRLSPKGLDLISKALQRDLAEVTDQQRPVAPPSDTEDAASSEAVETPQQWAAERLGRLGVLRKTYEGVVAEAVDQIRAQYPDGAYQRFEIERLPAVAAFSERVGAARTMAGLFVLLGLLFTMIRLNGVVGAIAAAAGGAALSPEAFLATMGGLMDGIGGAFNSSIWGLALLVASLVLVGAIDWVAQRGVHRLEAGVVHEVIPALAELQDRLKPNLTLADLLAETGSHLRSLSGTVSGLTGELDTSLSLLGDRIGRMMDDFRSFQDQYAKLDDLLAHLRKASKDLSGTSGALAVAAQRVTDPLTSFNKTLLTHVETVVDWVEVSRSGFTQLSNEMASVREHTDRLVEGLARAAETGFGEGLASHRATLAALDRQTADMQRHLQTVASSFDRAAEPAANGAPR